MATLAKETKSEEAEGWEEVKDNPGIYVPQGWTLVAAESGNVCVPNNQQAAYNYFESEEGKTVVSSVKTALSDKGDLTFGVTADAMEDNCWVVWYTFSISYNAIDPAVLKEDLAGLIKSVGDYQTAVTEDEERALNGKAANDLQSAIDEAEDALDKDAKAMSDAANKLQAAWDAAQKNEKAMAQLEAAKATFNDEAEDLLETASAEAAQAYDELKDELGEDNVDNLTTEEIIALAEKVEDVLAQLRIPAGTEEASDDNPIDMTSVIVNNSFEGDGTGSLDGWTYNTKATDDTKAAEVGEAGDTYYIDNADGAYVFNTWHGAALEDGYYVSQVLKALPAGTYELTVLLASDAGNTISLSANGNAVDFTIEDIEITDEDGNALARKAHADECSITFTPDASGTVEIKASSATWFKADNFRLTYYGAESTKELTGIEGLQAAPAATGIFNLAGQRVDENYKGIVIKNGKKVLVK